MLFITAWVLIQWMDFRGPSVTDAHLFLSQVQLIPKEGSLQQPLLLLPLTVRLQQSLHPLCITETLPHLLHLFLITLAPASRISLRLLVLSRGSQTLYLLPSTSAFPTRYHYCELASIAQHWHVLQNTPGRGGGISLKKKKIKHALFSGTKCLNFVHHDRK